MYSAPAAPPTKTTTVINSGGGSVGILQVKWKVNLDLFTGKMYSVDLHILICIFYFLLRKNNRLFSCIEGLIRHFEQVAKKTEF